MVKPTGKGVKQMCEGQQEKPSSWGLAGVVGRAAQSSSFQAFSPGS